MIDAFNHLRHWLEENDINPANVQITLTADLPVADRIGHALRRKIEETSMAKTGIEPIMEGHIYGITFKVQHR